MVCWAPGGFMSTVKHSVVGMRGYGHGCAMAGGWELSGAVKTAATGAKRARELGEEEEELTAGSERGSASSGRPRGR